MPPTLQDFKAELFKAMANPVRIRILEVLRTADDHTVTEIQQRVRAEPSNVSQHLAIMRRHGLVLAQRDGTTIRYSVRDPDLFQLLDVARSLFEKQLVEQSRILEAAREA